METFYLGAPFPIWLERSPVPLFVSYQRLRTRKKRLYTPITSWALDSGGFTELSLKGAWTITPAEYVADVKRYAAEMGKLDFAAPQDWMCEPIILEKTGLSIQEHQRRTVANFLELKSLAPEIPFMPVLQGWTEGHYLDCMDLYRKAGVNLEAEPRVGLGSVCRRQSTLRIRLWAQDWGSFLRLHAFGFKVEGLRSSHEFLTSADSMAWSFSARKKKQSGEDPEADGNSLEQALEWRERVLGSLVPPFPGSSAPPASTPPEAVQIKEPEEKKSRKQLALF